MTSPHATNLTIDDKPSNTDTTKKLLPNSSPFNSVADLITRRQKWETGAYQKTNDELYDILAGCLGLYGKIVASQKLAKGFRDYAKKEGFVFKAGTSMESRIVKVVFSAPNSQSPHQSRIAAYARVIKVAAADGQTENSLKAYINTKGGIDQIRRTVDDKNDDRVTPKNAREIAEARYFDNESAKLIDQLSLPDCLKPPAGQHYSAALVRTNHDGTGSIVFGTSSDAAVNKLLELAGRGIVAEGKKTNVKKQIATTQEVIAASSAYFRQELETPTKPSTAEV